MKASMKRRLASGLALLLSCACAGAPVARPQAAPPPEIAALDDRAAAARLATAVRLPTLSEQGVAMTAATAFAELRDSLKRHYPHLHSEVSLEVVAGHSLLYRWNGGDGDAVLLAAHHDVVPADAAGWRHPPFAGVIDESFVWGRGTLDDKGSMLAILEAVERLAAAGFQPRRTLYLAFGHDEENDGRGAKAIAALLAQRGVRLAMVLDEGSFVIDSVIAGIDQPLAMVGLAEKGYLTVELSATDAGGHSSIPPPTTAAGRIARAVSRLEDRPMDARLGELARLQLAELSPHMPWSRRLPLSMPSLFRPLVVRSLTSAPATAAMVRTTTAVTMLRSGHKSNVLPRSASAMVNFRILPGDSVAAVLEHLASVIDDDAVEVRIAGEPTEPSPISSHDSDAYRALRDTIAAFFPEAVIVPSLVLGMTDARSYQPIAADVYRFLPLHLTSEDLDRLHGKNERVGIAAYGRMIDFYRRLVERLAG